MKSMEVLLGITSPLLTTEENLKVYTSALLFYFVGAQKYIKNHLSWLLAYV